MRRHRIVRSFRPFLGLPVGNERGQTLVEFAMSLLVFLMTLFGTFQVGLAVWQYNMMSNLAQEGARWAAVRGSGAGATAASESDVQTFVRGRALNMNPTVSTFSVDASTKACTSTHASPSTLASGAGVCVKVTKSFNPFTRIVPLGSLTLTSTAQMIVAR